MATSPGRMLETPADKENIVLRSLVGDPNRHIPLADHRPPSTFSEQENQPFPMYIMQTRYQPIPAKALPKATDPRISYPDSRQAEESPPPLTNERSFDQRNPLPFQPEPRYMPSTVFLQPKVISQPMFYSIMGNKTPPVVDQQPFPSDRETPAPAIYSITGRPRRPTVDMSVDNLEAPVQVSNRSPIIYSVVGSPRYPKPTEEPIQRNLPAVANMYSIIGSPARTSRGVQVDTADTDQPSPILYTIVGDTPIHTSRLHEKSFATNQEPPTEVAVYKLNNVTDHPTISHPQPIPTPSLYSLVGKPHSPAHEHRTRPPARKRTPPPPRTTVVTTTRHVSRSLERKPELINDEFISYPVIKAKQQPIPKETKLAKSEMILVPLQEERRPPPPSQTNPKPYIISQSQPIQLSPPNRTMKPYREQKYNNYSLPVVCHSHSERKPRPPLYEPRYRSEKVHPYQPTSLERYPVNTKPRSTFWDGYQTQTDDDEEYEQRINRKKRSFKAGRPRAPWIPVW